MIDRKLHKATIEAYLNVRQTILEVSMTKTLDETEVKFTSEDLAQARENTRALWGWFKDARIFEFHPDNLYRLNNKILNEIAEGLPKSARYYDTTDDDKAADDFLGTMKRSLEQQVMPTERPFPCIYFGYGPGNDVKRQTIPKFYRDHLKGQANQIVVIGHLVTPPGEVWMMTRVRSQNGTDSMLPIKELDLQVGWQNLASLTAWVIPWLINYVNGHSSVITECRGLKHRRDYEKEAKKYKIKRPTPPPYYLVPIKSTYFDERRAVSIPRNTEFERQHRFDRRGHKRHLVRRGALPLEPGERTSLIKRGYRVWEQGDIDPELELAISVKGHVRKDPNNEWMTVRVIHIRDQQGIPYDRTDLSHITAARQGTNPVELNP